MSAPVVGSWHEQRLRVRYEETDTMKVVYYGKYFTWMEVGRVALFRDIGISYREWEDRGLNIPVVQAHADYRYSARFDDEILVRTKVSSVGRTSIRFENEIYKLPEMQLLCSGHTVHALVDRKGKTIPFPLEAKSRIISS